MDNRTKAGRVVIDAAVLKVIRAKQLTRGEVVARLTRDPKTRLVERVVSAALLRLVRTKQVKRAGAPRFYLYSRR